MGITTTIILDIEMVNFNALTSSIKILVQMSTDYGSPLFISFLNTNLIELVFAKFIKILSYFLNITMRLWYYYVKALQNTANLCF